MNAITVRSLIRAVADRWDRQYPPGHKHTAPDKVAIGVRLRALDAETATAAEVDAIIGNSSWTDVPRCDDCGAVGLSVVVQVGEALDYESATAHLCLPCLRAAVELGDSAARPAAPKGGPG